MALLLAALLACTGEVPPTPSADDARAYAQALRSGACEKVADDGLRDDCLVALAERTGDRVCDRVLGNRARGECWFRVAERTRDATLCAAASPYADDCALHVLVAGFERHKGASWPDEAEIAARVAAAGLRAEDDRPWIAFYRTMLPRTRPFDIGRCDVVADAARRATCRRAALFHWSDVMNRARDTGRWPCPGASAPPPADLAWVSDPELDALVAQRLGPEGDLCR